MKKINNYIENNHDWMMKELIELDEEYKKCRGQSKSHINFSLQLVIALEKYLRDTEQTWNYYIIKQQLLEELKK